MRSVIERTLYRCGWDTRCRNAVPARNLRQVLKAAPVNGRPVLLDVGSGGLGVAAFLNGVPAIGVDREQPANIASGLVFHRGDITALPYLDRSFPVVTCFGYIATNLVLGALFSFLRSPDAVG